MDLDSKLAKDFEEADTVLSQIEAGEAIDWDKVQSVGARKQTGYKMEAKYGFITRRSS